MSDTALIAIVSGIVTIITTIGSIYIKGHMDLKLKSIETKIDGRLTQLLDATKQLAAAEGLAQGKMEGRDSQKLDARELKDSEGGMKIEAGSVDITTQHVNLGEKKADE